MVAKVTVIGNLGRDPEFKAFGERTMGKFSVAVSKWSKEGKRTMWVNISCWDPKKNEVIKNYVHKGTKVMVMGDLEIREYQKDGNKLYSTEVSMTSFNSELQILTPKGGGEVIEKAAEGEPLDDEVPF